MTTKIESTKPDVNGKQTVIFQILPTHLVKERIRDVDVWKSVGGPCKEAKNVLFKNVIDKKRQQWLILS